MSLALLPTNYPGSLEDTVLSKAQTQNANNKLTNFRLTALQPQLPPVHCTASLKLPSFWNFSSGPIRSSEEHEEWVQKRSISGLSLWEVIGSSSSRGRNVHSDIFHPEFPLLDVRHFAEVSLKETESATNWAWWSLFQGDWQCHQLGLNWNFSMKAI